MMNPYQKPYHFAKHINARGGVSALCFTRPRSINLRVALWTNRREAVTCCKCLALLATKADPPVSASPDQET